MQRQGTSQHKATFSRLKDFGAFLFLYSTAAYLVLVTMEPSWYSFDELPCGLFCEIRRTLIVFPLYLTMQSAETLLPEMIFEAIYFSMDYEINVLPDNRVTLAFFRAGVQLALFPALVSSGLLWTFYATLFRLERFSRLQMRVQRLARFAILTIGTTYVLVVVLVFRWDAFQYQSCRKFSDLDERISYVELRERMKARENLFVGGTALMPVDQGQHVGRIGWIECRENYGGEVSESRFKRIDGEIVGVTRTECTYRSQHDIGDERAPKTCETVSIDFPAESDR